MNSHDVIKLDNLNESNWIIFRFWETAHLTFP